MIFLILWYNFPEEGLSLIVLFVAMSPHFTSRTPTKNFEMNFINELFNLQNFEYSYFPHRQIVENLFSEPKKNSR